MKNCLVNGATEGIRFRTKTSEKQAKKLGFTEKQATAILDMRLYKLIGLEIEALTKEHEETLKKIAQYEDILNHYHSMAAVIIKELKAVKKAYGKPRKTQIENAKEAVYEEKKIEEAEVVFLMDRFGYAKTVEQSVYERNKETIHQENRHIFHCMNTDKICVFTDTGCLHTIKVLDLPYGKMRDKGVPIDNVSNFDSKKEQLVYVESLNQIKQSRMLFATAFGMVKLVEGSEFEVSKRTTTATKLAEGDKVVFVQPADEIGICILQTKEGYFLRFMKQKYR